MFNELLNNINLYHGEKNCQINNALVIVYLATIFSFSQRRAYDIQSFVLFNIVNLAHCRLDKIINDREYFQHVFSIADMHGTIPVGTKRTTLIGQRHALYFFPLFSLNHAG